MRARAVLSEPRDGASLAVFRICFGLLVAYEIDFKFKVDKVKELYEPKLNLKYLFFEWVPAPGETAAYALHYAMIVLALLVAAGLFYRASCLLLCALLSYYFLAERTLYINHTYLYCLLAGIMAAAPGHNMLSLDARYGWLGASPTARGRAPTWALWLLRFQMGVVYSFAGLAKLNPDWLSGSPLDMWLPAQLGHDHWLLFDDLPLLMSWGGAAFDLSVTPLLSWKKTRPIGFAWAAAFHVTNASIFGIASFPWMSLALTTLFFEPDWPREQWPSLRKRPKEPRDPPAIGRLGLAALGSYAIVQLALPMRPWFYPDNSSWTEEGHEFSWHMMLRAKEGPISFVAVFPDGWRVNVNPLNYLTKRQLSRLRGRPDLIHQFCLFVADEYERLGRQRPRIYVNASMSFNGRPPAPLVDPTVDLAAEPRLSIRPARWILPSPKGPPGTASGNDDGD